MRAQLDTERLTLTPLTAADADELHALWTAPGVRRFVWDDTVIPPEQTAEIVARSEALFAERGLGLWAVRFRKPSPGRGDLAGFGGFWYFREPPELELIYGVAETHWGRGLATELAGALVEYAFAELDFAEIIASTDTANVASVRVLEALRFAFVRQATVAGLDTLFYRRIRPPGDGVPTTG
jgi:[ribosomal protein S5]-alanine N-acetyltransferase